MQLQQVMRDNSSLKRRIEAMEADVQRRTDTDRDKFTVRVTATQHSPASWASHIEQLTDQATCSFRIWTGFSNL